MDISKWQRDLIEDMSQQSSAHTAFKRIELAARTLGFDLCSYGVRMPLPLSLPHTVVLSNFPVVWQVRYNEANYIETDPTVGHGRRTTVPLTWADLEFAEHAQFWDEARSVGLRVGWCQSCFGSDGVGSMLTLSRSGEEISDGELESSELKMRTLVSVNHMVMSRIIGRNSANVKMGKLTKREVEVLRWSGDGKTAHDIAEILNLSADTVKFHIKNAARKLNAPNKTAAVVRATMSGLLYSR